MSVSAQDFTYQNASLNVSGPANANLTAHAEIVSNGSQDFYVRCKIISSTMTPGHQKYFCFGDYCYDTTTTVSPLTTYMRTGDMAVLSAYCIPNGIAGTSTVNYQIYDDGANSDTLALTAVYNFTPVGIAEVNAPKYQLAQASPNPANNLTAISYSYLQGKEARLIFQNLLGSVVKEIKLNSNQNTLIIPVAEFQSGMYIYTLLIDGKPAASKKLVIVHK